MAVSAHQRRVNAPFSSRFGEMRVDHDTKMQTWQRGRGGDKSKARPELRLWVNDIFAEDWLTLKRRRLPPQAEPSAAAGRRQWRR